jgi:hypothetical protein
MEGAMPLRLTEKECFLTWLWFFICSTAGGSIVAALVGAVTAAAFAALGIFSPYIAYGLVVASVIVSAVASFVVFRFFVRRLIARIVAPTPGPTIAA